MCGMDLRLRSNKSGLNDSSVTCGLIGVAGNAEKLLPLQEYAQYSIRGGSDISETTG